MNIQLTHRRFYLQLVILFVCLLVPVILLVSGSVKSFAESNGDTADSARENAKHSRNRWVTVDENELKHIQKVVQDRGQSFDMEVVEKSGRLSVFASDESQILDLTRNMHEEFHKCAGFISHETLEAARLSMEETLRAEANQTVADYTINNEASVNPMVAEAQESQILETITRLSTDFTNRRYNQPTGLASANWIKNKWTEIAAGRSDITVEFFNHPTTVSPQPSIILTVQGTTLPNEVVVVGGHQDSINHMSEYQGNQTAPAPGADDDASGIASMTEVIRVLVAKKFRPQRTVKFMAYAAEEVGLRGSNAIAADFQARAVNVVGVLQLDMTNYKVAGATVDIAIITDSTNAAQNTFIRNLLLTYQPSVTFANGTCGYACSDHASWTNKGFPASFPFEPYSNRAIHTTNDTLAQSGNSASHALKYSKLAVSFVGELAKGALGLTYEADVDPREMNGNSVVDSGDIVQIRRFVNRADAPDPATNEFQRADSSPFNPATGTYGDGLIQSDDIVQTIRFANRADSQRLATGPNVEAQPAGQSTIFERDSEQKDVAPEHYQRRLRVQGASASAGNQVTVNILVDAVGDEVEYGFSIDYDQKILTNPVVSIGNADGTRSCNSQSEPGRIYCSSGNFPTNRMGDANIGEIAPGDGQVLVSVTFTVSGAAQTNSSTEIKLTNVNAANDTPPLQTAITSRNGTVSIVPAATAKKVRRRL